MEGFVIGERMEVVRGVLRDEFGDIQVLAMDVHRSSPDCGIGQDRPEAMAGGNDLSYGL
jgi:hypothetical protein